MKRLLLLCLCLPVSVFVAGCSSGNTSSSPTPTPTPAPTPASTTSASLSATSFDFGGNLVGNSLSKSVVTVTNTGTTSLTLQPALSGDSSYAIVPAGSCGASLASGVSCPVTVSYTPTAASGKASQTATLSLGIAGVSAATPQTVALTGSSAVLAAGIVATTNNPQVALYSLNLPFPGSVTVSFGTDTTYGRKTWTRTNAVAGPISILVAGMLGNTAYHMQAAVQFANGLIAIDADHTFTTGTPTLTPTVAVTTTPGQIPSAGIEQLTFVTTATPGGVLGVAVTDLQGGTLWSYVPPGTSAGGYAYSIQGAKMLPNGHYLLCLGPSNNFALNPAPLPPDTVTAIREIDLAGNIIREISVADLTNALTGAGYKLQLLTFHHDVTPLPNGHWLVLSNTLRSFTDLPGYPGVTNVIADVVIDLDRNLEPVWVWDEFDHLDVTRHPMGFPDLTHTNAVIYSPTDNNIIVSMRHQNWVVKVDYNNGTGSGNILWRLGQGGDFALQNGVDPTDWNYAQHFPSLFTPQSAGVFSLGLMDNGNDRAFPTGVVCGSAGAPPCQYTTIPVYQIDETAKTASLTFHQILPANLYSYFGGNTDLLKNGNIEYDLSATNPTDSDIFEVTPTNNPQTVWHMHISGMQAYRGARIPSLYPGVQW